MGRLGAWILGRKSERRAAKFLKCQGFSILARNVRGGRGEIDIVARDGEVLVLVEVRRRADALGADLSVTAAKEARVLEAWAAIRRRHRLPVLPVRVDLVLVEPTGTCVHLVGALFRARGGL